MVNERVKEKVSKAQQKAVAKYDAENYDKFLVRVPLGSKKGIQAYAQRSGMSLNGFVLLAVARLISEIKTNEGDMRLNYDVNLEDFVQFEFTLHFAFS